MQSERAVVSGGTGSVCVKGGNMIATLKCLYEKKYLKEYESRII